MNLDKRNLSVNDLVGMQDELNKMIMPNWKQDLTPRHFIVQIIKELGELLDSGVEYKWWKHTPEDQLDVHNMKVEIIDIVHFAISVASFDEYNVPNKSIIRKNDERCLVNDGNKLDHHLFTWITECLINLQDAYDPQSQLKYAIELMISSVDMNSDEFSALYYSKYLLNQFRQENGYKEGTYQKVKNGVEDNELLESIVSDFLEDSGMMLQDIREVFLERFSDTQKGE